MSRLLKQETELSYLRSQRNILIRRLPGAQQVPEALVQVQSQARADMRSSIPDKDWVTHLGPHPDQP
jgi:hypothetical protein